MARQRHQTTLIAQRPTNECRSHGPARQGEKDTAASKKPPPFAGSGGLVTSDIQVRTQFTITTHDMSPRYMPGDTLILRNFPSKAAQNCHAIDATVTTQSGKTIIGTILHADAKGITLLQLSPAKRVFICAKENPILSQIIAATRPKTAVFSAKTNDARLRSA